MLIIIHGTDAYRRREKLQQLVEKFRREVDPSGINIARIDSESLAPGDWTKEIGTNPFLSRRRMVIGRDLLTTAATRVILEQELTQWQGHALSSDPLSPIVVMVESSDLVAPPQSKRMKVAKRPAVSHSLAEKNEWIKELLGSANVFLCATLEGEALGQWIKEYSTERGARIQPQAVRFLVETQVDTWTLAHLLDVCIAYRWIASKEPLVTLEDCEERLGSVGESSIFPVQDALLERNATKAHRELSVLIDNGIHPLLILSQIARSSMLLIRALWEALPAGLHPFVVKKITTAMKQWSIGDSVKLAAIIGGTELALKSTDLPPEALLARIPSSVISCAPVSRGGS